VPQPELGDELPVSLYIGSFEIVQQSPAAAYHLE
jgi:hypothetical protein